MQLILTTLSPTNIENQKLAVSSWLSLGYNVKSINSKADIENLKRHFNIEFIETDLIGNEFGKDYVRLNAFTDYIKKHGSALIINSDIEILEPLQIEEKEKTIEIFNRNDYSKNHNISIKFESGFDAFYITKEFSYWIPKSRLVIGQCHWDYFLPLIAIKHEFTLLSPKKSNMYHKKHQIQYNNEKWRKTGKIFAMELGLSGDVLNDSRNSHKLIKSKIVYY
jgi:hypothetical protein